MVTIEVPSADIGDVEELRAHFPQEVTIIHPERFDGADVLHALVNLSPATVPFIVKALCDRLRRGKSVDLYFKGLKVHNITEQTAITIVREMLKNDTHMVQKKREH